MSKHKKKKKKVVYEYYCDICNTIVAETQKRCSGCGELFNEVSKEVICATSKREAEREDDIGGIKIPIKTYLGLSYEWVSVPEFFSRIGFNLILVIIACIVAFIYCLIVY